MLALVRTVIHLVFACWLQHAVATVYYVASNGSDSNAGTSTATPWSSIGKVNSMLTSLRAGDSVLFRRGDTFRDEVTLPSRLPYNFTFSSYGSPASPLPVISGALSVPANASWVSVGGAVYALNLSTTFPGLSFASAAAGASLYIDDQRMTLARWPNRNLVDRPQMFRFASGVAGSSTLLSRELTQPSRYWNGATVHMRLANWMYVEEVVTNYTLSGGTARIQTTDNWAGLAQWTDGFGFYFDDLLSELDTPGEWYLARNSSMLYLRTPQSDHPSLHTVEIAYEASGFRIASACNRTTISYLHFDKQRNAISAPGTLNDFTLTYCRFTNQEWAALSSSGFSYGAKVTYSTVANVHGMGLYLHFGSRGLVAYNNLTNIGLWEGQNTAAYGGSYPAIVVKASETVIAWNYVDNVGANAVLTGASNNWIDNNDMGNCMQTVNDGACVYTSGGEGVTPVIITNNRIHDSLGQTDSSAANYSAASGIYFDYGDVPVIGPYLIFNNSIYNHGQCGLYLVSSVDGTIVGNNFYSTQYNLGNGYDPSNPYWTHRKFQVVYQDSAKSTTNTTSNSRRNRITCNTISTVGVPVVGVARPTFGILARNVYVSPNAEPFRVGYTSIGCANLSCWSEEVSDEQSTYTQRVAAVRVPLPDCVWRNEIPAVFWPYLQQLPPVPTSGATNTDDATDVFEGQPAFVLPLVAVVCVVLMVVCVLGTVYVVFRIKRAPIGTPPLQAIRGDWMPLNS